MKDRVTLGEFYLSSNYQYQFITLLKDKQPQKYKEIQNLVLQYNQEVVMKLATIDSDFQGKKWKSAQYEYYKKHNLLITHLSPRQSDSVEPDNIKGILFSIMKDSYNGKTLDYAELDDSTKKLYLNHQKEIKNEFARIEKEDPVSYLRLMNFVSNASGSSSFIIRDLFYGDTASSISWNKEKLQAIGFSDKDIQFLTFIQFGKGEEELRRFSLRKITQDLDLPSPEKLSSWIKSNSNPNVRTYYKKIVSLEEQWRKLKQEPETPQNSEKLNLERKQFLEENNLCLKDEDNAAKSHEDISCSFQTPEGILVEHIFSTNKAEEEKQLQIIKEEQEAIKELEEENKTYSQLGMQKDKQYIVHLIGVKTEDYSQNDSESRKFLEAGELLLKGISEATQSSLPNEIRPFHTAAAFFDKKENKWKLIESAMSGGDTAKEKDLTEALNNYKSISKSVIAQETTEIDVNKLRSKIGSSYGELDFARLAIINKDRINRTDLEKVSKAEGYEWIGWTKNVINDEFLSYLILGGTGMDLPKSTKQFLSGIKENIPKALAQMNSEVVANSYINESDSSTGIKEKNLLDLPGEFCTELVLNSLKTDSKLKSQLNRETFLTTPTQLLDNSLSNNVKFIQVLGDKSTINKLEKNKTAETVGI